MEQDVDDSFLLSFYPTSFVLSRVSDLLYVRCWLVFGHDLEGALKMRDWKMRDWNYRHQTAGEGNAGLEISAPCYRGWKMRDWNYREQETYGTPRLA